MVVVVVLPLDSRPQNPEPGVKFCAELECEVPDACIRLVGTWPGLALRGRGESVKEAGTPLEAFTATGTGIFFSIEAGGPVEGGRGVFCSLSVEGVWRPDEPALVCTVRALSARALYEAV